MNKVQRKTLIVSFIINEKALYYMQMVLRRKEKREVDSNLRISLENSFQCVRNLVIDLLISRNFCEKQE